MSLPVLLPKPRPRSGAGLRPLGRPKILRNPLRPAARVTARQSTAFDGKSRPQQQVRALHVVGSAAVFHLLDAGKFTANRRSFMENKMLTSAVRVLSLLLL